MTKNQKLTKLLCLVLSLVMALSSLAACKESNTGKKTVKKNNSSKSAAASSESESSVADNSFEEDSSEPEVVEPEVGPADETERLTDADFTKLRVYNGKKPISNIYKGVSGTVYHAYGFMKDDQTGRVYNNKMMNTELTRLQNSGMRYCRTRYNSAWVWNAKTGGYDFENMPRINYFYDYCRALQSRNINVVMSVGWHFQSVTTNRKKGSINEVGYLYGDGAEKYGETATWGKYVAKEYLQTGTGKKWENVTSLTFADENITEEFKRLTTVSLRFGEFFVQTLKALKAKGIHNVSHLLYFTEPSYFSETMPQGWEADEYLFVCKTINNILRGSGVAAGIKHMGPNQGSIQHGNGLLRYIVERDPDLFDVYSAHFYPSSSDETNDVYYDVIEPVFESYSSSLKEKKIWDTKEFWVDEFFCRSEKSALGQGSGWASLQTVVGGIIAQQKGIDNVSLWQIFDQLWTDQTNTSGEFNNGIHVCGTCPSLFVSSIPRASYYPISLFSRYNGYKNGTVYQTSTGTGENVMDLYIGAVQLEDGNWTITVVNATTDDMPIKIDLEKVIGKTLYRHYEQVTTREPTTAARLADADRTFVNVQNKLVDIAPAASVIVYTSVKG